MPDYNVNNPFGRDVAVSYSYAAEFAGMRMSNRQAQSNLDAHVELSGKLSWLKGWHFETGLNYGKEDGRSDMLRDDFGSYDPSNPDRTLKFFTNVNPFGNGSDAAIVDANRKLLEELVQRFRSEFSSEQVEWNNLLRGDLFALPAGNVELALGLQLRREKYQDRQLDYDVGMFRSTRDGTALFAEAGFPLLRDMPFAKELTLTVAARYERFRQTGDNVIKNGAWLMDPESWEPVEDLVQIGGFDVAALTGGALPGNGAEVFGAPHEFARTYSNTSPLARLSWRINDALRLRATWGKSFVTPTARQLFGPMNLVDATYMVSLYGVELPPEVMLVQLFGPNPYLKPQVATTRTYGFDFNPEFAPGLTLSMTYNDIDYANYIASFGGEMVPMSRIFDAATQLPPGLLTKGPDNQDIWLWDAREINYLGRSSRSVDLGVSWFTSNALGDWRVQWNTSRMLDLSLQALQDMPKTVIMDSELGPSKWASDLLLGWDRGRFNATIGGHYSSAHRVLYPVSAESNIYNDFTPNPNPLRRSGASITWDAQIGYRTDYNDGWLGGMSIQLGARNLFNRAYPFVDNVYGFISSRQDARGRVIYLDIRKEF